MTLTVQPFNIKSYAIISFCYGWVVLQGFIQTPFGGNSPNPNLRNFPHEVLARSMAASKSSDCSDQTRYSHWSTSRIQSNVIVHRQRYHWGTEADSVLGFAIILELAKILTREHLQALPVTVNITSRCCISTMPPRKYINLLLMQRKVFSFWGWRAPRPSDQGLCPWTSLGAQS